MTRISPAFTVIMLLNAPLLAQPVHEISSTPICDVCRIAIDSGVLLSVKGNTRAESLSFSDAMKLIRVRDGMLAWHESLEDRSRVAYFSDAGKFEGYIARRGQGPGELQSVADITVGPADTITVVEAYRRHVFSPDRQYLRSESLPGGYGDLLQFAGGSMVLAARIQTPEHFGFPLHMIDAGGNVLKSFGLRGQNLDPRALAATNDDAARLLQRRIVRSAESGTFWTYNPTRFLLERYDVSGAYLSGAVHAMDGWYAEVSRRVKSPGANPGLSLAHVIASEDPSLIWLVYHDQRPLPENTMDMTASMIVGLLDVILEAVDTRTYSVLATLRLPKNRAMPLENGPDRLILTRPYSDLEHTYRIVRLRLER